MSKTSFAILPEIFPEEIWLIKMAKFFGETGESFISIFFSFKTAKSSTIIQFFASLISAVLITSSKNLETSISETRTLAS